MPNNYPPPSQPIHTQTFSPNTLHLSPTREDILIFSKSCLTHHLFPTHKDFLFLPKSRLTHLPIIPLRSVHPKSKHPSQISSPFSSYRMSRKGSETPSKSKRLVDETDDFHVPSFNILSQTQAHKSKGKEKCSSVNSKMNRKTKSKRQEEERKRN